MLTYEDILNLIKEVKCRDIEFRLLRKGDGFLVQATAMRPDASDAPDPSTGLRECKLQKGRKWYVSPHSARTEIVETLFSAAARFELHELKEDFRFKGQAIYNSHISADDLAGCLRTRSLLPDCREGE
jgi:hypothetical protein